MKRTPDVIVALITIASLPLFVAGLGDTYLWQDEAQTALLGRSVARHGIPMVGSGAQSLSAHMGADAGINGIYLHISWLQAYVAAASFRIFGESSWSARLPFAIAGWLCVPLVAWVVRRAGASVAAARLAALLTATSVPFIVCSRQSRYYALTAALTLVVCGTYAALVRCAEAPSTWLRAGPRERAIAFGAAATLLVLSFDITAIGVLSAVALHWTVVARKTTTRPGAFWMAWGVACLVLVGWIGVSLSAPMRHTNAGIGSLPERFWIGILYYTGQLDSHVVPLPIAVLAVAVGLGHRTRSAAVLIAAIAIGGLGGAMLSPVRFFRYVVPVVPVIFALAAIGLAALADRAWWGKVLTAVIVIALVSSSAPFAMSHHFTSTLARATGLIRVRDRSIAYRIPLADMLRELRDPPKGPIAAVVDYLRRHAHPGDVLVTTYEELPLKFHTTLDVYGGETAQLPADGVTPDWIWVDRALSRGGYQRIELEAVDRRWENREDPEEHIFSNPGPDGPRVVLYRAAE
jgi:4-amino-4-deoxy-L-arabinose transferase-like glycosyltransferase